MNLCRSLSTGFQVLRYQQAGEPVGTPAQALSRSYSQADNEGCNLCRCDWHWQIHFTLTHEAVSSRFYSLPFGPLHKAAQDMAFARASGPGMRKKASYLIWSVQGTYSLSFPRCPVHQKCPLSPADNRKGLCKDSRAQEARTLGGCLGCWLPHLPWTLLAEVTSFICLLQRTNFWFVHSFWFHILYFIKFCLYHFIPFYFFGFNCSF